MRQKNKNSFVYPDAALTDVRGSPIIANIEGKLMSFKELWYLVVQLLTSWQVIAVTVAVFLYFFLVLYVGRIRYKIKSPSTSRPQKIKKIPRKATPTAAEEDLAGDGGDLNIEEEG
jgi:hypothetical protein